MAQNSSQAVAGESGRFQVVEKREDKNLRSIEVLIKGKDFVSYNERTLHGLCEGYRMIKAVSSGLLEVSEYHHCQKDHEDFEEDFEEGREDYKWAYVETEDAGRVIGSVGSLADFNKIYATLYECIANGWGKTVRCKLEKAGAQA